MNLLEEEQPIIDRLKAELPAEFDGAPLRVASVASAAGVFNIAAVLPIVLLVPGEAPVTDVDRGRGLIDVREWFVVAALAHKPDMQNLQATYQAGGQLLGQVVQALAGWAPALNGFRELRFAGREAPEIDVDHVRFPLRFTVQRFYSAA